MTTLLVLGIIAFALIVARSQRMPASDPADVYYDDDEEYEAPAPIRWGISDYQPWPGDMLFDDVTNAEYKDEIARLWNAAIDEGETEEAAELLEEYGRLCRAGY